jgi:hypothetical protein
LRHRCACKAPDALLKLASAKGGCDRPLGSLQVPWRRHRSAAVEKWPGDLTTHTQKWPKKNRVGRERGRGWQSRGAGRGPW